MKKIFAACLILAVLVAGPAFAAATDWQEVAPGARLRAISAGVESEKRALIGLELELQPGLLTYWRVPGETGLPTSLVVSDATGPRDAELFWPVPERDLTQGFVDFVYRGNLVLPALVDMPLAAAATIEVRMGICSDICVPVLAQFALPGDNRTDVANSLRLRQALADTPVQWQGGAAPLTEIAFDRQSGALTLVFDPARIDPQRVFPSLDGSAEVFSAPEIETGTNRLSFTLLARRGGTDWSDKALRLTFATPDGPYDIVQTGQTR